MSIKKFLASAAALAICSATMILPASAGTVNLGYTSSGNAAYSTDNNGTQFRLNLYNTWGNNVTDLDNQSTVEGSITVNVTISGLNGHTTNVDDMGNPTDAYSMYLAGSVGTNQFWGVGDSANNVDNSVVSITGDGTYDVVFMLNEGSESIECLFLQTNINIFQLGIEGDVTPQTCGVEIVVNSVTTETADVPEETTPEETTSETEAETTTEATTTTAGDTTTTADETTKSNSSNGNSSSNKTNSSSSSSNKTNSSSNNSSSNDTPIEAESLPTGDTGVVGIAFAGLIAAGCATLVIKKK